MLEQSVALAADSTSDGEEGTDKDDRNEGAGAAPAISVFAAPPALSPAGGSEVSASGIAGRPPDAPPPSHSAAADPGAPLPEPALPPGPVIYPGPPIYLGNDAPACPLAFALRLTDRGPALGPSNGGTGAGAQPPSVPGPGPVAGPPARVEVHEPGRTLLQNAQPAADAGPWLPAPETIAAAEFEGVCEPATSPAAISPNAGPRDRASGCPRPASPAASANQVARDVTREAADTAAAAEDADAPRPAHKLVASPGAEAGGHEAFRRGRETGPHETAPAEDTGRAEPGRPDTASHEPPEPPAGQSAPAEKKEVASPSTERLAAIRIEESVPVKTARSAPSEIAFRVPDAKGREAVDVRVLERAGRIHIAVRSGNDALNTALRERLGELVAGLDRKGYQTESWAPEIRSARLSQDEVRQAGPDQRAETGGGQAGGGEHEGQQRSRQRRPEWLDELERTSREPAPRGAQEENP